VCTMTVRSPGRDLTSDVLTDDPDVEVFDVEVAPDPEPPRPGRLPYFPGLDGLRGLSVLAVLLFHAGAVRVGDADLSMPGGYLGVSTFFTLSGFLIASLLLGEHRDTAKVSLTNFYSRRIRRLLPAAVLGVGLAVVVAWDVGTEAQLANLRADAVSAFANVANWHYVVESTNYAEAFSAPSPLLHYWSLAIEEQFYLLFPVVVGWILTTFVRGRRVLAVGLALGTAVSVAIAALAGLPTDRVYFGTDARLAELLVGALLAVALFSPRVTRFFGRHAWLRAVIGFGGVAVLAGMVALWCTASQRESRWVFEGGLAAYALASAVVVFAAILPASPTKLLLSFPPLRWLGLVSYGLYVFHFPIFLWVQQRFPDLEPTTSLALKLGLSLLAAVASYRLIERPVRAGRPLLRTHPAKLAPVPIMAVLLALLLVTRSASGGAPDSVALVGETQSLPDGATSGSFVPVPGGDYRDLTPEELAALEGFDLDDDEGGGSRPGGGGTPSTGRPSSTARPGLPVVSGPPDEEPDDDPDATAPTTEPPPYVPKVLLVGGSEAFALGVGANQWASDTGFVQMHFSAVTGCGLLTGGTRLDYTRPAGEEEVDVPDDCEDWRTRFANELNALQPDIVMVLVGVWDLTGHRFEAGGEIVVPGDGVFNDRVRSEYAEAARLLTSTGAELMWLDFAPCGWGMQDTPPETKPPCLIERREWMNALLVDVNADVGSAMHVLPYSNQLNTLPGGPLDPSVTADGIHLLPEAAKQISGWLIPRSVGIWQDAGGG
jgi:peptidoglycan/LPS O-acetylase OafA/YrhL